MAFICGCAHSKEEDDYDVLWPYPSASPRKPARRRSIFGSPRNKRKTNPYSDRGLDKFEALLADLDNKRQQIFTQKGSEDVTMVKFIYRSPDEVKPIVVKLRDHHKHENTNSLESIQEIEHQKDVTLVKGKYEGDETKEGIIVKPSTRDSKKKTSFDQWKPSYYFPLFVILILVLLMFSGRSFAILCISLGWYLVPIFNESLHNSKQHKKIRKKEHTQKVRRTDKQLTA